MFAHRNGGYTRGVDRPSQPHPAVPKMKLDELFLNKEQIAQDVKEELTKSMSEFGYAILQALVTGAWPSGP